MAKRTPNYFLVLLMLVISIFITYWAQNRPAIALTGANIKSIPTSINGWNRDGADISVDKGVLDGWNVTNDNFLMRDYVGRNGDRVNLMVVYKGRDRRAWHLSEMCFNGSGYNVDRTYTQVPYAGKEIPAVKLYAEDKTDNIKTLGVYFFASGRHAEGSFLKQQLMMATTRLHPTKYGWAFVRVTSSVDESQEDTLKRIRQFLKDSSDQIEKSLTCGDGK